MAKYLKPQTPLQHQSGDYIYPITTVDQVITAKGERLNANLISVDLNESVESDTNINLVNNKPKAGFIYPLASEVIPEGFLLCDGAEYLRAEYPELFAAIGIQYGEGDGSTTFNVPNLQTRVPVGAGDGYELGATGGEEKHLLTTDEMPKHNHNFEYSTDDGNTYSYAQMGRDGSTQHDAYLGANNNVSLFAGYQVRTSFIGDSQSHNNMQPYTVVNYIIATGKNAGVSVADIITGAQALPLGVEYGGTGATNTATARANLGITPENIGAMSMDLLWENASPSSEFTQKEISVPGLSNYKMIVIETARGTFFRNNNVGYLYMSGAVSWSVGDSAITSRVAEIRNSSILFMSGYVVNVLDRTVQKSDNEFVPVRIYGIKGVL